MTFEVKSEEENDINIFPKFYFKDQEFIHFISS